jgi:hypothetical protein
MQVPARPQAPRAVVAALLAAGLVGAAGCGADPPARSPGARAASSPHATRTPQATPDGDRREATGAPLRSATAGAAWTLTAVVERLAGRHIRVGRTIVPLEADTLTCGGEGAERRRGGRPAWQRFRCVQPTFRADGLPGPDAVFIVEPTGRRTFIVRGRRLTSY